jgi:hypothetical protein
VHTLSSLQPLVSGTYLQLPVFTSHVSCVQASLSSQVFCLPGAHVPWLQASFCVQALSSALHAWLLGV